MRIRKSKKNRQHNDKKKKDKRTNNDVENTNPTKNLQLDVKLTEQ